VSDSGREKMMKNRRRLLILVATSLSVGALVAAASGLGRASSAIEPVVLSSPSGEPPGNSFSMRIHYDPPPQDADPAIPADEAVKTAEAELGDADQVIEVQPVLASYSKTSFQVDKNDDPIGDPIVSTALVWVVRVVGPCLDEACAYKTNYVVVDATKGQVITAYPDEAMGDTLPKT
jgi:hypothetical protein